MAIIETINPHTGKVLHTYEEMSAKEATKIIESAHEAFLKWKNFSFAERGHLMREAAHLLQKNKQQYATIITQEMGKPIIQSKAEIEKCALVCNHYAENAEEYLKQRIIKTEMQKNYVTYRPLGIIFAIMPWNFPFWQVFRFAAPTLMAGNGALLKHAPISTGAALAIENIFKEAGFPKDLFRSVILDNDVAATVIKHAKVAAVTLTGSGRAGQAIGSEAAQALKKAVLELGGSDPYLILEDADLELASEACIISRLSNAGQVCIAAKRIIIVEKVYDAFAKLIKEKMKRFIMGDPMDEKVNFGPLSRKDIRDGVHKQVQESVKKGAQLVCGGELPKSTGFYYPPTLLMNVHKGMPAFDEEIFGPVVALIKVKDEDEAIKVANDTPYGLAGAVFTKDIKRGEKIAADKIEAGTCAVNTFVASDPRLPFGGIKESGYGRELAMEGIKEFVNAKTISIK